MPLNSESMCTTALMNNGYFWTTTYWFPIRDHTEMACNNTNDLQKVSELGVQPKCGVCLCMCMCVRLCNKKLKASR